MKLTISYLRLTQCTLPENTADSYFFLYFVCFYLFYTFLKRAGSEAAWIIGWLRLGCSTRHCCESLCILSSHRLTCTKGMVLSLMHTGAFGISGSMFPLRPVQSGSLRWDPEVSIFLKFPTWFQPTTKVENHWPKEGFFFT